MVAVSPLDGFGGAIVLTDVAFKFAGQAFDGGEDSGGDDIALDPGASSEMAGAAIRRASPVHADKRSCGDQNLSVILTSGLESLRMISADIAFLCSAAATLLMDYLGSNNPIKREEINRSFHPRTLPSKMVVYTQECVLGPFAERSEAVLLKAPAVDRFHVEAPVAAHFKRRQLPELQLTVHGRRMNFEVVGQFLNGHYVV